MHIDIADQRKNANTILKIDEDVIEAYCGMAGVDMAETGTLKIRFRNGGGPYGFAKKISGGYRIVINVRYKKTYLSPEASYVVSNTLLHEIRHIAQMQGPKSLSSDYNGWSETEARKYGRTIKGQNDLYAIR